jgi:pyruvate kinase
MGDYPLESVEMLAKIATVTESAHLQRLRHIDSTLRPQRLKSNYQHSSVDLIALSVENILEKIDSPAAVLTPTASGHTARSVTRFRLPVWILGVSPSHKTCQELQFSYGVWPIAEKTHPGDWTAYARSFIKTHEMQGKCILQTEGPSPDHPNANNKIEIIDLSC